jgi:hypothetical protein
MRIRKNDKLAQLKPEDRAKLDAWLENESYRRVIELVAAPRPEGLGLTTNLRALSCYYNRFLVPNPVDELAEFALHNPEAAEKTAAALLQTQAIYAAANMIEHKFDPRKFNSLVKLQEQLTDKKYRAGLLDYKKRMADIHAASGGLA